MIKIGNSNIVGVSQGNTQFSKIYKGADLYWSKTPKVYIEGKDFLYVLLEEKTSSNKILVPSYKLKNYPVSDYSPIGINIIPSSHNICENGDYIVMSFQSKYNSVYGGKYDNVKSNGYNNINYFNDLNYNSGGNNIPSSSSEINFNIPTQRILGDLTNYYTNLYDNNCGYLNNTVNLLPSQYNSDCSKSNYTGDDKSPLSDFNGLSNTLEQSAIDAPSKILNLNNYNLTWYIPACGEIMYLFNRLSLIYNIWTNIKDIYKVSSDFESLLVGSGKLIFTSTSNGSANSTSKNIFEIDTAGATSKTDRLTLTQTKELNYTGYIIPFTRGKFEVK